MPLPIAYIFEKETVLFRKVIGNNIMDQKTHKLSRSHPTGTPRRPNTPQRSFEFPGNPAVPLHSGPTGRPQDCLLIVKMAGNIIQQS